MSSFLTFLSQRREWRAGGARDPAAGRGHGAGRPDLAHRSHQTGHTDRIH